MPVGAARRALARRDARPLVAFPALAALALALAACAAGPEPGGYGRTLYVWSDARGSARYTSHLERVPPVRLPTLQVVEPGRSAEATAALLPGSRTAAQARDAAADAERLVELDRRIAELEREISRDEETLKILISEPESAAALRGSEELSAISRRLPERQALLHSLRAERALAAGGDAP